MDAAQNPAYAQVVTAGVVPLAEAQRQGFAYGKAVRARTWLLVVSALSVPFTLTHSVEDFSFGIAQRFGLPLLFAAFLLSLGYAAQVVAAAQSARDRPTGHLLNAAIAAIWLLGSVLDHVGEVLFAPTAGYRAGLVSKGLEVGVMLASAVWLAVAARAWWASARATQAHRQ